MKCIKKLFLPFCVCVPLAMCASDLFTGKSSVALAGGGDPLPESFAQCQEFLNQNVIVSERTAAKQWGVPLGQPDCLKDYQWERHLVQSGGINAWRMPGRKIVVYMGSLPTTQNENALAVVPGHEASHAIFNRRRQNQNAGSLRQIGSLGAVGLTSCMSETARQAVRTAYGARTNVANILPFSRENENEADHYGLILIMIAERTPEEAAAFWDRMSALGGGTLDFPGAHPFDEKRVAYIQSGIPDAQAIASIAATVDVA
ncbi:MAG: M48 family metallopeptidase [Treponema sp.]|jgi:hypothetical protein|nr:M48 family metallopeptidase [Treponema sp.]